MRRISMLTVDQLRVLAEASRGWGSTFNGEKTQGPHDFNRIRELAMESLGRPNDDEVASSAIELLENDDRNLRVAALRILAAYRDRDDVVGALLVASHDPVRRVRALALSLAPPEHPAVRDRLTEVAQDDDEYHRIRTDALARLAKRPLDPETLEALRRILDRESDRRRILFTLASRRLDDVAAEVLRDIVRNGTKEEAIAATRALCGWVLVRSDNVVPPDSEPADINWVFQHGSRTKTKYVRYYWVEAPRTS
jgi:HEAT repeat protein